MRIAAPAKRQASIAVQLTDINQDDADFSRRADFCYR